MDRRQFAGSSLFGLAGTLLLPASVQAAFATKPVTLIVPFPPGGTTDVLPRLIAQDVGARLGQPLVVVNRPGAGGALGTKTVIAAEPDGHTILLQTTAIATGQAIKKRPDFDVVNDLAPITLAVSGVFGIFVNPSLPVKSVGELIAYAKANPAKLNYGSGGIGAANHLMTELLCSNAGVQIPTEGERRH